MQHSITLIVAAAAALALATPAAAENAVISFTGGVTFQGLTDSDAGSTVGWAYTTSEALSVTALGWWTSNGSIAAAHQVGIWSSAGVLQGLVSVTAGAANDGVWRFENVMPFALAAGTYHIGGLDFGTLSANDDTDQYTAGVSNLVVASPLVFVGPSFAAAGLAFPDTVTGGTGRFGPNFRFNPAVVPEPATWAMLIAGFGLVGTVLRRRSAAASGPYPL